MVIPSARGSEKGIPSSTISQPLLARSGTTFKVYLPASDQVVQEVAKSVPEVVKGTGTVLIVDDEEPVLEVGKELLEVMKLNLKILH